MEITIKTDDVYEIESLMNAENFRSTVCDIGNYLRSASDKGDSTDLVVVSDIYEKLYDIMNENNINRDLVGF